MKSHSPTAGPERVIAIGASAGGVEALQYLVRHLPSLLNAAVCVVLHVGPESPSLLGRILARHSVIRVVVAEDGMKLHTGTVYVAQPDYHLVVQDGRLRLLRGPRENRHRPAIDALFRSVAENYGKHAIGVVLTGFLDDGTAGLQEIKRAGGFAIVQDPDEAVAPDMPRHAIDQVSVDEIAKLEDIPRLLVQITEQQHKGGTVKTSKNGH
ncbi:MAG TPA: chemotaxis protein CheB, partial [Terriglobales bacterium]|nr:chemotaxis protein CheB [Terriglobales bacterium]